MALRKKEERPKNIEGPLWLDAHAKRYEIRVFDQDLRRTHKRTITVQRYEIVESKAKTINKPEVLEI